MRKPKKDDWKRGDLNEYIYLQSGKCHVLFWILAEYISGRLAGFFYQGFRWCFNFLLGDV